jgi:rRNA maturation endonuclease Nob1
MEIIGDLEPEDVIKIQHGKWKTVSDKYPRYVCTNCNHLFNNKEYKYCPFCGADMRH